MSRPLRAIVVEDREDDALLLVRELRAGGFDPDWRRVESAPELEAALREGEWDVLLSDFSLPAFDALAAMAIARRLAPGLPILIVSGAIDEEAAVTALKGGARDFVTKGRLARLVPAVERELRAETGLRRAEERYRDLFEWSPDAIFTVAAEGRFVDANPAFTRLFGYPRDELGDLTVRDLCVDPARPAELFERLRTDGFVRDLEVRLRRRDGRILDVEASVWVWRDERGRALGQQGVIRDVTDRKRSEATLRRRTAELGERVKEMRTLLAVSNLLSGAEEVEAVLGDVATALPPGWQYPDLAGARIVVRDRTWETPGYGPSSIKLSAPVVADGREIGGVEVSYRPPGPPEDEAPFLPEEEKLLAAVAERIGETLRRRDAERALEGSERRHRAMIERSEDILTVLDADGRIVYESPSFTRILGYSLEEVRGRDAFEMVHPEDRERLRAALAAGIADPALHPREVYRCRRRDGSWVHLESTGSNRLADPDIRGLVINTRDVTGRVESERDRERLEAELRHSQRLDAIGRLAGGVAHDFNNLLTVIDGYTNLLLRRLAPEDSSRSHAEEVRKAAARAAALTRQLLAFSRKQVLKPRVFRLNEVLGDIEKMLGRLIGEDVVLRTACSAADPRVRADASQIEQVLMNLVVNAREAMPRGGTVRIETALDGANAVVTVADDGEGMTAEVREHLFEPFFTTKESGTGLGLATVYGIVKQSGGEISVETSPGCGTTFRVSLPAVTEEPDSAPPDAGGAVAPAAGATILLVEDDDSVRELAREILEEEGYRILAAGSTTEAADAAASFPGRIDLLLTDVVMPGGSGRELADRLRSDRPDLPVLFVSGYSGTIIARHGVLEEGIEFLEKPFSPAELRERVARLVVS